MSKWRLRHEARRQNWLRSSLQLQGLRKSLRRTLKIAAREKTVHVAAAPLGRISAADCCHSCFGRKFCLKRRGHLGLIILRLYRFNYFM